MAEKRQKTCSSCETKYTVTWDIEEQDLEPSTCPFCGFEVTDEDTGFLNAKLFLSLSALIALLAFVGNAFNQGLLIPIPILSALAVMMLLFVPTAFSQNNLGADSAIYENTRIPNAELFDENGESYTITELFDGKDALVIGIGLPASENLIEQSNQFNVTLDKYGDNVAIIHVLSGMNPMDSDIIQMRQQLNTLSLIHI